MRALKKFTAYVKGKVNVVPEEITFTTKIKCNMCTKVLWDSDTGVYGKPSYFHSRKQWNKSSPWPDEYHEFHLCRECYSDFIQSFKLPVN